MAGRSDFSSVLPRQIKRMITMGLAAGHVKDNHHFGDVKSLFVAAHKSLKDFRNKKRALEKDSFTETAE